MLMMLMMILLITLLLVLVVLLSIYHLQAWEALKDSNSPVVGVMVWMIALDPYPDDKYTLYAAPPDAPSSRELPSQIPSFLRNWANDVNKQPQST